MKIALGIVTGILIITGLSQGVEFISMGLRWYFHRGWGLFIKIPLFLLALLAVWVGVIQMYNANVMVWLSHEDGSVYFRFWMLFLLPLALGTPFLLFAVPVAVYFSFIPWVWTQWQKASGIKALISLVLVVGWTALSYLMDLWQETWWVNKPLG